MFNAENIPSTLGSQDQNKAGSHQQMEELLLNLFSFLFILFYFANLQQILCQYILKELINKNNYLWHISNY